jgi:ABC-type lipoprotein export system ATPase subunit
MANSTILKVEKVKKSYKLSKENFVNALNGVDLDIKKGEMVAVMGPSGSGKSTLLNMLGALDKPTEGEVMVGNESIGKMSSKKLASLRNRKMGFIFQNYDLIPTLTALENVVLPLKYAGVKSKEAKRRAEEELKKVGLSDRIKHLPSELSGGQQQRVAIARALVNNPEIILADEPTGNLDTKSGNEIISMIIKLNKELGQTFIIVTHNPDVAKICDRIIKVIDGKIA